MSFSRNAVITAATVLKEIRDQDDIDCLIVVCEKTTDGLASWLGVGSTVEMIKTTRGRDMWRGMIANAMQHGTG
ncbi:hypothetical protein ElyMa_003207200 [Elysia marginata]|uniref:Uncharacterized protein n=1 Tax=Elysia marginata TaxID=1093978 RepID=A0AAV4J2K5_9GAST|nr:hypothetical protein ElyMa_003207200 [Elysia marginata]